MHRDWSELPSDAIEEISKRLDDGVDYVRFRSVCTSWRSGAPRRPQLPWLLVKHFTPSMAMYEFPNPNPNPSYPRLPDTLLTNNHICGCSRGWIALAEGRHSLITDTPRGVSLRNPFTGAIVRLPDLPLFLVDLQPESKDGGCHCFLPYSVKRFILSSDPVAEPNACIAMAAFDNSRMAFCRLGDDTWTPNCPFTSDIDDIIFYHGRFFAVNKKSLFFCDTGPSREVVEIMVLEHLQGAKSSHLVESVSGDLLLVRAPLVLRTPALFEFYWIDLSSFPVKRMVRLDGTGGNMLFLGLSSSSLSACGVLPSESNYICRVRQTGADFLKQITVYGMESGNVSRITEIRDGTRRGWRQIYWLTPSLGYGDYGASSSAGNCKLVLFSLLLLLLFLYTIFYMQA